MAGAGGAAGAAEGGLVPRSASGYELEGAGEGSVHGSAGAGGGAREGETAAQTAARAEFKRDTGGGIVALSKCWL